MKELFIQKLESLFGKMQKPIADALLSGTTVDTFDKDSMILSAGNTCQYLRFIAVGCVRIYELHDETERTTHFFTENQIFLDFNSFTTGTPTNFNVVAVEDTQLISLHVLKLAEIYTAHPEFERMMRLMAENQSIQEFELRKLLLNCTGIERYQYLIHHMPELFKRFALKDIASFIGITPESLSRLRRQKITPPPAFNPN